MNTSNILYGKVLVAAGDSFTEGDFNSFVDENGKSGKDSPVIYDKELGMYKTYPWWIAQRNHMSVVNEAKCGSILALSRSHLDNKDQVPIENKLPFSLHRYQNLPDHIDYLILEFGLNDMYDTYLGDLEDTTNETFYGAWNVVYEYLITKYPYTKIATIISDSYLTADYRIAIIETAVRWGIPYLDLWSDPGLQATMKKGGMCQRAVELRTAQYHVSPTNAHPNVKAHEARSAQIEAFLRRI